MAVLGMIHGPQAGVADIGGPSVSASTGNKRGAGAPEDRTVAQTRWLDGSAGHLFGGTWSGGVRTGASCDSASLELRAQIEAAKQTGRGAAVAVAAGSGNGGAANGKGGKRGDLTAAAALAKWKPNPDTPDSEKWGGRWGKPCGHNEVCWENVLRHMLLGSGTGLRAIGRKMALAHDHFGTWMRALYLAILRATDRQKRRDWAAL